MTVYSRLVKVRVPPKYSKIFRPKSNKIDFIWYPYEHDIGERFVQLVTTNKHPTLSGSGVKRDLDDELNYMPVCQDAVKEQHNSPKGPLHTVTTFQGHPGLQGERDFLKSRMNNLSDKWLTKEQLIKINNKLKAKGYTEGLEVEEVKHHPTKPISLYRVKVGDTESG